MSTELFPEAEVTALQTIEPQAMTEGVSYATLDWLPGYRIGDDGSFWSRWNGRWGMRDEWRRLKPAPGNGYLGMVVKGGKTVHIHILVLEAFVGPRPAGMEACHGDGNPLNNALTNLRWDTPKGNASDRIRHGTHLRGDKTPSAKLTMKQVREIRARLASNESQASIAADYPVNQNTISRIATGQRWGATT